MRRNGDKARDYAQRHGVPRWYGDADELIADPEVNAVYIATPPDSHAEYTVRAARAGKPVYVEKPMARDPAECARMIDACRETGVPLFVAYYRRRPQTTSMPIGCRGGCCHRFPAVACCSTSAVTSWICWISDLDPSPQREYRQRGVPVSSASARAGTADPDHRRRLAREGNLSQHRGHGCPLEPGDGLGRQLRSVKEG